MQDNFRKQAMGFNKKDVIEYIYSVTSEKEKNEKESAVKIDMLTSERDTLSAENEALKNTNKELDDSVTQLRAELAEADVQKSRLYEEVNDSRRIILDNEREFNIKNEQIAKLISENEDYAEKCNKYAEISRDVGKIVMEAKQMAADIVKKANDEAEEIKRITEKKAAEVLGELTQAREQTENLRRNLEDMSRVCENRINTVEQNLKSVGEAVSSIGKAKPPQDGAQQEREFF